METRPHQPVPTLELYRLVFVSHFNSLLDGGAATAARRLHDELCQSGVDSRFYHGSKHSQAEAPTPSYQLARWRHERPWERVVTAIRYRMHRESFKHSFRVNKSGTEIFTSPLAPQRTAWPPLGSERSSDRLSNPPAEIIHLHWIAKFLDYESFFASLDPTQPVVWTLHDMNAFTGGCHFTGGCDHFRSGCGRCPQLKRQSESDVSRQSFIQKQRCLKDVNLHVVAPSRWLLDTAKSSLMLRTANSFTHIPYGVPVEDLYPMDRLEARARLGLSPDATIICFGAMDVKNHRKGAAELMRALSMTADLPEVECLVFGGGKLPQCSHPIPKIHEVGLIQGSLQKRTVYSASDLFVLPSLEDNLPLTGMEAMACGTPIVGFAAGGIPDYVRPHRTGLLAPTGDAQQLGQCLRELIENPAFARLLGDNSRAVIQREYNGALEASRYKRLYNSLLGSGQVARTRAA